MDVRNTGLLFMAPWLCPECDRGTRIDFWNTGLLYMAPWLCPECDGGTGLAESNPQLWDRHTGIRQGTSSGISLWGKSFCSSQLSSPYPKKANSKVPTTFQRGWTQLWQQSQNLGNPISLSCLGDQCLMVFGMHWALCICYSNSSEVYLIQVLSPYWRKIPVMVNNKEPEEPWGQQLCFPAQHAISETLEFLES